MRIPTTPRPLALASLALLLAACPAPADPPDAGDAADAGDAPDAGESPSNAFTIHYHRALNDYAGWTVEIAGDNAGPAVAGTNDGFGAVFTAPLNENPQGVTFTLKNGDAREAAGAVTIDLTSGLRAAWVYSGSDLVLTRTPGGIPGANEVVVHYARPDKAYDGWGLHTWGDVTTPTDWSRPLQKAGTDADFGAYFKIPVKPDAERVNIIVHSGDNKDPGPDMGWNISELGHIVFLVSGSSAVSAVPRKVGAINIVGAAAHLLTRDTLAWKLAKPATTFELRYSTTAAIKTTETDVTGGEVIALTKVETGLPQPLKDKWPHLKDFTAFSISGTDVDRIPTALTGQLVAVARDAAGVPVAATQVQTPGALDDLFPYDGPNGVTFTGNAPSFHLWAPTAQSVSVEIADDAKTVIATQALEKRANGLWAYDADQWKNKWFRYKLKVFHPDTQRIEDVTVTDPWSVNVDTNGRWSQVLDLTDASLKPAGWDTLAKPPLAAPEDITIYELHVRDFSALDTTVPAQNRGKFLAFTTPATTANGGTAHLKSLADAGLSHLHLLPSFDLATVNEDTTKRVELTDPVARLCELNTAVPATFCTTHAGRTLQQVMEGFAGDSEEQQQLAEWLRGIDGFNWGYDPLHYGVPEGSYASNPEGTAKIVEFRTMVQSLAALGLRVVMDVVYNHTNASGIGDKSVLDKVVPGYFHRRNAETGSVETSTCCANTATEHRMMERLMVDTLVRWARDYKVDAFRFDLMGHHMKSNMEHVRDTLAALRPETDGVDGRGIYLYGEGWNFGEVANGQRGVNAVQLVMGGTGIGTFNDRLRDSVRGGSAFDSATALRKNQGYASGLFLAPNELNTGSNTEKTALADAIDRIKVGMTGNLKDFILISGGGSRVSGSAIGYNGARTGYTLDPQESINYVSKHDNQTLFDISQLKHATGTSMADRARAHVVALSTIAWGQGVPFFHAGDDLLRSKSVERDSYDSGDWFNRIDWTGQTTQWKKGLPAKRVDQANWPVIRGVFGDASIAPTSTHTGSTRAAFRELLSVRRDQPLLRLRTGADVMKRVDFHNTGPTQVPGVIVMSVTDGTCAGADLDPARDAIVVAINAGPEAKSVTVPGAANFRLLPALASSADPVVRTATTSGENFTIPARTAAVFERPQDGAQGTGVACNTR